MENKTKEKWDIVLDNLNQDDLEMIRKMIDKVLKNKYEE